MTNILLRFFVKDYQNTSNPAVRASYGKLAGAVGIFCNLLLFAAKILIGTISGAVSISADAVNNLSDASSSVVTLLGFKLAEKPADAEHPYGHARIEYLSGLAVAGLILIIGFELCKTSVQKILHPAAIDFSAVLVVVLLLSIALKLWMALFNRKLGKRIDSAALMATSTDSRNDVISTAAVLLACVVGQFTGLKIDGYMGLLVALFILWSGIGIAKETISPLLGQATDPALVKFVREEIMQYDKVLGLHDLIVHDYGPGQKFASVHVEMDMQENVLLCHDIIDDIERHFKDAHNLNLVIHYDPVVTNDAELNAMRAVVEQVAAQIHPQLSIHDFRMVRGPGHNNLIFDMVIPFSLKGQEKELQEELTQKIQQPGKKYYTVITFDDAGFNTLA